VLFEKLSIATNFLNDNLLKEDRQKLANMGIHHHHSGVFLGRAWWGRFWDHLLNNALIPNIPDELPSHEGFNQLAKNLLQFEECMLSMGQLF
jgi:hypothetical protein